MSTAENYRVFRHGSTAPAGLGLDHIQTTTLDRTPQEE
jgi:hypothetical protein